MLASPGLFNLVSGGWVGDFERFLYTKGQVGSE